MALGVLLIVMTGTVYLPVRNNNFINYDDDVYITRNENVLNGISVDGIKWAWVNRETPYWFPITFVSYQVDAQISTFLGSSTLPGVVHAQNVFWHCCCVLLLFRLLQKLFQLPWRSFFVAALFALHPMHVESVAWAAERKDVLMCFFGLLTVHLYIHFLAKRSWLRYALMLSAYLLSLMSKPMLITLPFVLLLLDFWPLGRWGTVGELASESLGTNAARVPFKRLLFEKLPLLAAAMVIAMRTMETRMGVPFGEISFCERLMNALMGYRWYLATTFWPTDLGVLYPHPYGDWSINLALAGAAILILVTVLSWIQRRRRPWLLVGWLWFVGTLFPVIGFDQGGSQAWADRFVYWPHIGLFVAIVWAAAECAQRLRLPNWSIGLAGTVVLGVLGALTWIQVEYWRDSVTVWERALAVTTNNDRAHQYLSLTYRSLGRTDEANAQIREAQLIQRDRFRKRMGL